MRFDSVTWAEFAASIVSFVRLPRITMVHWSSPSLSVVKLNSDGCSKWNPGPSGGDAVLRDSSGAFIFTYSCYFGIATSLAAEVRALLMGVKLCISNGYNLLYIESDSKVLLQILEGHC